MKRMKRMKNDCAANSFLPFVGVPSELRELSIDSGSRSREDGGERRASETETTEKRINWRKFALLRLSGMVKSEARQKAME